MSTPTVQCPKCFTRVPDTAGQTGEVMCPGCESTFVPDREGPPPTKPALPVARAIPVRGKVVDPAKPPAKLDRPKQAAPVTTSARKRDDYGDDERPRPRDGGATAGSRRREVDDDERPQSSRRRRYDDDDEPKKKGGVLPLILICGGGLLLLTLGGAAAVVVTVMSNQPVVQATTVVTSISPPTSNGDTPLQPRGNWNDPNPFLEPKPDPWKPGDFPARPDPFPVEPLKPKEPKAPPKYADVTQLPLKPAKMEGDTAEVKLPGKAGDACSGGGGRFYIVHISDKRQLAVFDVNEAKVVKYIALASDTVKFAAGMNKLVVAYPDQGTFTRYDLTTFEKEVTVKNPLSGTVGHLCMGSASAGPLLVSMSTGQRGPFGGGATFLDPATFKEVDIELANPSWHGGSLHFRASPDGTVFGVWSSDVSPNGLNSITVRGGKATARNQHTTVGHIVPGPDNRLYTAGGLYTSELKRVGKDSGHQWWYVGYLPAVEGALYLHVPGNNDPFGGGGAMPGEGKLKAEVKMVGDDRSVFTFKNLGPFSANNAWGASDFITDKRIHFAPSAHLLVTVPSTNDKLVLHKFDLEGAFEASGVDYLYVASRPPTAIPGKGYEYQIGVRSKKGGVKYKLDAGPDGLKVSEGGKVTWAAPHDFKGPEQVIITVSDASGQEVFHSFELVPGDGKGFAGPIVGAPKVGPKADDKPDPKTVQGLVTAPDRVFEIKPPLVQEKASVALPGQVDAVCVGGGGRFLIYRLGTKKQLAVLDVTLGKVAKYLPLAESDALFAAGMTKLFIYYKTAGAILRYDLEKFEKELTAQNPLGGSPLVMLMGHSSDGPLYLGGTDVGTETKGYGFINPRTMKELKVPIEGQGVNGQAATGPAIGGDRFGGGGWAMGAALGVAVSPDGHTYCWTDSWGGNRIMTLTDKVAKVKGDGIGMGQNRGELVPGPDGHLFGALGILTSEMKKVGDANVAQWGGVFAPATSGSWYIKLVEGDRFDPSRAKRKVSVGLTSDERVKFPLDSLHGLPVANQEMWMPHQMQQQAKVPMLSRLHLVPEAEILAVLDDGMEKVHLHRVPVKSLLEKSETDYMMVVSRPPPAVRGVKWTYTPEVWSKKGGVKVKVESGPDGMKATGGTVSWEVPAKPVDDEPAVILTVSDASGQESFHTFNVSVRNEGLPAVKVIRPTVPAVDPVKPIDPGLPKSKAPVTFPLKPTAAKDGTDITLPAAADYACLAGGGRFILLRIPSKKLVAVFDVVDGSVVKELAVPEDGALIAGSRSFAYIVNPKAGLLQRWSLSTFEKEATTKLPDGLSPEVAVIGHASEGPLFLGGGNNSRDPKSPSGFFDPLSLKKIELKKSVDSSPVGEVKPSPSPYTPDSVSCSPDGRVWAWWSTGSSPSGLQSLVIEGDSARGFRSHISVGPIVVGSDGVLFTGAGVFAGDQSKVFDATVQGVKVGPVNSWREVQIDNGGYFQPLARTPLPAAGGPFYLWFPAEKVTRNAPRLQAKPNDPPQAEVPPVLKLVGVPDSLGEVKGLRGLNDPKEDPIRPRLLRGQPGADKPTLLAHQRTFIIPAAELLAVLSQDGTKIHIHSFKARELIDKSGQEYLLVMGQPPQFAPRGQKWVYTPDVWSKKGGVKVEVVSGPVGLKAVGAVVEWAVPTDLLDNLVVVELKVTDASDRKVTQRFALSLDGSAPTAPVQTNEGGINPKPVEPAKDDPMRGAKKIEKGQIDEALVGNWSSEMVIQQGVDGDNSGIGLKGIKLVIFADGTCTVGKLPGIVGMADATFTSDPTASPKALDLELTRGPRTETRLAVYEVNGNTLKVCYTLDPKAPRPAALKGELGKTLVAVFRRVKDEPGKGPPVKSADPVKKEEKGKFDDTLVGSWQVTKFELNGSELPSNLAKLTYTFGKDGTGRLTGGPQDGDVKYTVDTAATPKTIDLTTSATGLPDSDQTGVYEVTGDTLRLCTAIEKGAERPKTMKSGEKVLLMTLKRVNDKAK